MKHTQEYNNNVWNILTFAQKIIHEYFVCGRG